MAYEKELAATVAGRNVINGVVVYRLEYVKGSDRFVIPLINQQAVGMKLAIERLTTLKVETKK
jgi:hypothetical protein